VEPQRIDLHTHSFLSDGVLLPSELLRRAEAMGHRALAITDHADASNIEYLVESLRALLEAQPSDFATSLLIGVELTHVSPGSVDSLAHRAKACGAEIVVVHGETIVEPVAKGTNRAALESEAVDLLAHPGFLSLEEARMAAERGCCIEITARKGHSLSNGHVARVCRQAGAALVLDTDAHEPGDLATFAFARQVGLGAGLTESEVHAATVTHPSRIVERILASR
jgi:histidinol phosphatase-like PHP family hydrolase